MVEPVSQMPGAWEVAMGEYSLFEESLFLAISLFGSHTTVSWHLTQSSLTTKIINKNINKLTMNKKRLFFRILQGGVTDNI